jgi:L-ascorbate metabolism protein UlaG (beta-lactamase superfamily)
MKITKLGHSCLLVEEGDARLLLDPGSFSTGFEELTGLTAVLVTHQHADHLDVDKLPALLERNPGAALHTDEATAGQLAGRGLAATAVHAGDVLDLGARVRVVGRDHAVIHPDVPIVPNVGYLVAERFFHPGDSLTVPDAELAVLAVPAAAPWLKSSEAVDYLRAVRPRVAVPIHDAVVAATGIYYGLLARLKPADTEFRVIDGAGASDF